jgi:hydroxymethylglutaryl-CoA lyase
MSDEVTIEITEVGPRDGLQNEPMLVATDQKIAFINALSRSGLRSIEVSSFVSPKWVPQLADAEEVFASIDRCDGVTYSALVPNEAGLARALAARVDKIAVFSAVSEAFCQRNINATFAESLERFRPVIAMAKREGVAVRAYLSCVLACPYAGVTAPEAVAHAVEQLLALGNVEVSLGDTLGVSTPETVEAMLEATSSVLSPQATVLHLHDTNGRAISSVARAVSLGVRAFDSAAGGLGGCPFADGATGNLATEHLLAYADEAGWTTGVDAAAVASARAVLGPMSAR